MLECVHETRFFALGDFGDLHRGTMRPIVIVRLTWALSLLLLFEQLVCGWLGHQWSRSERIYTAALGAAGYFSLVHLVMLSLLFLFQSEQKASRGRGAVPSAQGLFCLAVFSFCLWKGPFYNS
jgi:hypothetical protein